VVCVRVCVCVCDRSIGGQSEKIRFVEIGHETGEALHAQFVTDLEIIWKTVSLRNLYSVNSLLVLEFSGPVFCFQMKSQSVK
jgi:hypothetical protein